MNTCPDCKCQFVQPFKCITCGAEKLYDTTVRSQEAHIRELEAEVKMLRETIDAMETIPTGMSQAVCRAMAKYWNGLANRMAQEAPVL
jgi:hypothetical protein